MRSSIAVLVALLSTSMLAPAQQLDSNSITVSASRSLASAQPDQIVFTVLVNAPPSVGLTEVLAAVQSLGVTAANFASVNTNQASIILNPLPPNQLPVLGTVIEWSFNLTVPVAKVKETVTALTNTQKSIGQNNSGLTLSFRVQTTQLSAQALQSQPCSVPDLLTDARAQAQKLADAAGLNLGAVLAVSGATLNNGAATVSIYSLPQVCAITVKYAASRY